MAKQKSQGGGSNSLGWMLTFSDLITLLLTFFVMLLSMKQPEIQKLQQAFSVFSSGSAGSVTMTDMKRVSEVQRLLNAINQPKAEELAGEEQKLAIQLDLPLSQEQRHLSSLQKQATLKSDKRGTVITLANDLLFRPGHADLAPGAAQAIHQISDILRYSNQPISVEGHTDSTPLSAKSTFSDNWNLSLARALAVLAQLKDGEKISPKRLRAGALGDTRPLAPNETEEGRAMNRRTEIVLLTKER